MTNLTALIAQAIYLVSKAASNKLGPIVSKFAKPTLDPFLIKSIVLQLAEGLAQLHAKNVALRNLHISNIGVKQRKRDLVVLRRRLLHAVKTPRHDDTTEEPCH